MNATRNKAQALLGLLVTFSLILATFSPGLAVQVGNDTINFIGVRYDFPSSGQSTWYYEVTSGSRPAISHVSWELNLDCLDVLDAGTWDGADQGALTSGGGSPVIGTDPTTGTTGIKFDQGFEEGETRYYYFTVDGNYAQDDTVVVASKGGPGYDTATITGPSPLCEVYVPPAPAIDIEKLVNGEDADAAPGISVTEGDMLTFDFAVTNTGNVPLIDIAVVDDVLGQICTIASLDVGETVNCSASGVVALLGLHTNIATATGSHNSVAVSDSDPANYTGSPRFIANPAIDIEKYINGNDADEAPGVDLVAGDNVTFEFVVTNTGNVGLTDIDITDDVLGTICGLSSLGVGESATCTVTAFAVTGLHTNVGTATGEYESTTVSDSDPANYTATPRFIPNPVIDIEKYINGDDADAAPGVGLTEGDAVTFEFVVTNSGNVALTDIEITDDILGAICGFSSLGVGESASCDVTSTALIGLHTNIGTASAKYTTIDLTDSDPANYTAQPRFIPAPAIDLEKMVNGEDADAPTGPLVLEGDLVTFDFIVTNTGNVDLSNVTVADSVYGAVCVVGNLLVGESMTCTITKAAVLGQHANTGTATGEYGSTTISDSDLGHYYGKQRFVPKPGLDIEKLVNGEDADAAPGVYVPVGSQVTFTYIVTNTGNVNLTNITVADNVIGIICKIPSLAAGASMTCTATSTAIAGQYKNIGKAGTYYGDPKAGGILVHDIDRGHYFGQ